VTKILGDDSHSSFSQIKNKNFLSPHISYLPDRYIDEVEYSLQRRTHATEGYILKRHKSHFQDEPLIFM
jgi:hypothetical protein